MTAASGPTQRVIEVLRHLSEFPAPATLNELSLALSISKSTLHSILKTLRSAGFVLRDEKKLSYSLGPALIPLGHAALGDRFDLVQVAFPIMKQLSERFRCHCSLTTPFGDRIGVLAITGNPTRIQSRVHEGEVNRAINAPPLGALYVAWAGKARIQEWLDRADPPLDEIETTYYRSRLDHIRSVGFAAAAQLDATSRFEKAFADYSGGQAADGDARTAINRLLSEMRSRYMLTEIDPSQRYEVEWVAAPVFEHDGTVRNGLILVNFPSELTGAAILDAADALITGSSEISRRLRG